jgi:ABC-2 type transport system ATP-binding protein
MTMHTAIPAVELEQVTKNYGSVQALKGISLTIEPGEVVAILGPNGAGKTTTISLMIGMRRPSSGCVMLFGKNPRLARDREHIGVMLQESGVPATLKVRELVELFGRFHEHPMPTQEAIKMAGLEEKSSARLAQLSGGQKQRVYFALALVGNPEVLFLDEPTTGLDVESRLAFWEQITHQTAQGKTIILTTHNLEEADALARRIVLINLGQIIADGTPEQIKSKVGGKRISFRAPHTTLEELSALVGTQAFQQRGNTFEMLTKDPDAVLATLTRHGVELSDLEVVGAGLEEAFLQLTSASEEKTEQGMTHPRA